MGSAREAFIQNLLADYLPGSFVVEPGFVASAEGDMSGQMDVLITRGDRLRRLAHYAGFSVQPVENVYAAIEVKTSLDS